MERSVYQEIFELTPTPVYVCNRAHVITIANEACLKAWGKDRSVIGKPFLEALPEMKDQIYSGLMENVMTSGESYHSESGRADLVVDGKLQTYYYKFSYQPMYSPEGGISALCAWLIMLQSWNWPGKPKKRVSLPFATL